MEGSLVRDRYRIAEQLGEGGKGVVHRARDLVLDREVAIKFILPKTLTPESREHFRREARTAAGLEHPAIAQVYDFGQHEDELFIVMPLVQGLTLRILIEDGTLGPETAIAIAAQVADALDYGHRQGVVHGDVKPENVMVEGQGDRTPRVRVVDFGLADGEPTVLADTLTVYGTPLYMSPERLLGEDLDPRSDIYALGLVLYECLAGRHPLEDGEGTIFQRALLQRPGSLRARGVTVTESLDRLVLSCLAKDPGERPQSAREVLEILVDVRG